MVPLIAAQLVKNGDFLAPSYPQQKYGYGCILYDHFCSTATQGISASQHLQQTSLQLFLELLRCSQALHAHVVSHPGAKFCRAG